MRKPGRVFDADVDIHEGCFFTRKGRNTGSLNKSGYHLINLKFIGEKYFAVYTLHFAIYCEANNIKSIPKGFCIHHRDNNTSNNTIENLCLCTPSYNNYCAAKTKDYTAIYNTRKKNGFKQTIKAFTKDGTEKTYPSMSKAAQDFSVNVSRVSRIVNKKQYHGYLLKDGKTYDFCRA